MQNESFARVAFDTPGSQMKRELSATISFNVHSNNVTLTLQSASNSFVAKGIIYFVDYQLTCICTVGVLD